MQIMSVIPIADPVPEVAQVPFASSEGSDFAALLSSFEDARIVGDERNPSVDQKKGAPVPAADECIESEDKPDEPATQAPRKGAPGDDAPDAEPMQDDGRAGSSASDEVRVAGADLPDLSDAGSGALARVHVVVPQSEHGQSAGPVAIRDALATPVALPGSDVSARWLMEGRQAVAGLFSDLGEGTGRTRPGRVQGDIDIGAASLPIAAHVSGYAAAESEAAAKARADDAGRGRDPAGDVSRRLAQTTAAAPDAARMPGRSATGPFTPQIGSVAAPLPDGAMPPEVESPGASVPVEVPESEGLARAKPPDQVNVGPSAVKRHLSREMVIPERETGPGPPLARVTAGSPARATGQRLAQPVHTTVTAETPAPAAPDASEQGQSPGRMKVVPPDEASGRAAAVVSRTDAVVAGEQGIPVVAAGPLTPPATFVADALPPDPLLTRSPTPDSVAVEDQLRLAVRTLAPGVTEIRLDPPQLGAVRLDLHTRNGIAVLHVSAEQASTLELLRSGLHGLVGELRGLGFDRVETTLASNLRAEGDGGAAGRQSDDGPPQHSLPGAWVSDRLSGTGNDAVPDAGSVAQAGPRLRPGAGLDLRL